MPKSLISRESSGVVLAFVAYYMGAGVLMPYFPVWLHDKGLSASQIAFALSIPQLLRMVSGPVFGQLAARTGVKRVSLVLICLCFCAFAAIGFVGPVWCILALTALGYLSWQSSPLYVESEAISLVRLRVVSSYGSIRAFGSSAYIVGALSGGALLGAMGSHVILGLFLGICVTLLALTWRLPESADVASQSDVPAAVRAWTRPDVIAVVLASALVMCTHQSFTSFGALLMRELGFREDLIGILLAVGTACELMMFALGARYLVGKDPVTLIMIGAGAAIFRWCGIAFASNPWLVLGLQVLNGLTFAGTYLGFTGYLAANFGKKQVVSVQGIYIGIFSACSAALTMLVGAVFDRLGGQSFFIVACFPAISIGLLLLRRTRRKFHGSA